MTSSTKITRAASAYPYSENLRRAGEPGYNPVAHGGCSFLEWRGDGKTRLVNCNAGQEETGPWR